VRGIVQRVWNRERGGIGTTVQNELILTASAKASEARSEDRLVPLQPDGFLDYVTESRREALWKSGVSMRAMP
jgi:hypothetical protein